MNVFGVHEQQLLAPQIDGSSDPRCYPSRPSRTKSPAFVDIRSVKTGLIG
jgi:hypothetical protein